MNHYSWSRRNRDKAKPVVLCTGTDSVLLHTQKLILEQAGYIVITAKDRNTVMAACKQWIIDVAVVGQAASRETKVLTASLIREYCAAVKILELYSVDQGRAVENADSWLEVPAREPQELAANVWELAYSQTKKAISA